MGKRRKHRIQSCDNRFPYRFNPEAAWDRVAALPDGYIEVMHEAKTYGLTITRFNGGRSVKLYAEERGGRDVVSANLYSCATGVRVMPCEMTPEKVHGFLLRLLVELN